MTATAILIAAAVLAHHPTPDNTVARDQVDLIETNHYYDQYGSCVFTQTIFYALHNDRMHVVAWRMLKTSDQRPIRDYRTGQWVATWNDGSVLRQVTARHAFTSWTLHDPELMERSELSANMRRDLHHFRSKASP